MVVYDKDNFSSDEVGGSVVRIGEIISAGAVGVWFEIFYKNKSAGKIFLKALDWKPVSSASKAAASSTVSRAGFPLKVMVVEANLTRDTETFSKMDPFAELIHKGQIYKTKTLDGAGKKPRWNEEFELNCDSPNDQVVLKVSDADVYSSDEVGSATLTINQIANARNGDWFTISYKNKPAGKVLLIGHTQEVKQEVVKPKKQAVAKPEVSAPMPQEDKPIYQPPVYRPPIHH